MRYLEKIRNLPREKKVRLVWAVCLACALILLGLWSLTSKIGKTGPADTSLFKSIGNGFKDLKNNWSK